MANIISKIVDSFPWRKSAVRAAAPPSTVGGTFGDFVSGLSGRRQLTAQDFDRLFKGWVYSCVHKRGGAVAKQVRRVYQRSKTEQSGRVEVDSDHPLVKLFDMPMPADPFITPFDIWAGVEEWICVSGEAYVYTPRNGGKYPVQMWSLPSNQVFPRSEGKRIIDYFEWYSPRGLIKIAPEEMLFFRESAPGRTLMDNLVRGFSRLEAAIDQVRILHLGMEYLIGDLEAGGLPFWFVKSDNEEDTKEWKKWQALLVEDFYGPDAQRKPGMLHKGWDVATIDMLGNKGPIIQLVQQMGQVVCGIFGVPISIVTGDYGPDAPATLSQEVNISFEQHEIAPQLARYDSVLTRWGQQIDPELIIAHDPIEWQNPVEVRADEIHRLKTGRVTIDGLRKENGEELLNNEIGSQVWVDSTMLPAEQVLGGTANALPVQRIQLIDPPQQKEEVRAQSDPVSFDPFADAGFADHYWLRTVTAVDAHAVALRADFAKWFVEMRKAILSSTLLQSLPMRMTAARAMRTDLLTELGLDWDYFESRLLEITEGDSNQYIRDVMRKALEELGENYEDIESEFDEWRKSVVERTTSKIKEPVTTLRAEMQTLLQEMVGKSADEMRQAIRAKFRYYSNARASTIAQTTATYVTGASQTEAWKGLGVTYRWLSMRTGNVRPTHTRADGNPPNADGLFEVGTDRMPHPGAGFQAKENANCRCTLRPELVKLEHVIAFRALVFDPWEASTT